MGWNKNTVWSLEFPESRASIRPRQTNRNNEDASGQRCDEFAHKQNEAKRENEAEHSQFCIVARTRRIPTVEDLHHRSHERRQQQHQCPELEKSTHLVIITWSLLRVTGVSFPITPPHARVKL